MMAAHGLTLSATSRTAQGFCNCGWRSRLHWLATNVRIEYDNHVRREAGK